MKLEKLSLVNFMSVRSLEVELKERGLVLIQGKNNDDPSFDSNGAGKSTIFEGLSWLIFDQTVRGLSGDEVVNENIGKNCYGFLDFKDEKNEPYRIARYRKHNEHKNSVYIYKNGKNITPKSAKDTNKFIEDLFGMDFSTFTNSILFGQGLVKMFTVATDKEKKEILERMLQMDEVKKCLEVAKKKREEKTGELSVVEAFIGNAEGMIDEINTTISSLKQAEKDQLDKIQGDIQLLQEILVKAKLELENHNAKDYTEELGNLIRVRKKLEEKIKSFDAYQETKSTIIANAKANEVRMMKISQEISKLLKEIKEIESGKGTNCPACGQTLPEDGIEEAVKHVVAKIAELKKEKTVLEDEMVEYQKDLDKINRHLEKKEKYLEQKDVIIGEISSVKASIRVEEDFRASRQENIDNLESSIVRLEKEKGKTFQPLIEEKTGQLEELKVQLEESEAKSKVIQDELSKLKFWVDAFGNSGIKSYLLDSVTPFLNKQANSYLRKLAGSTTQVEFSTQTRLANGELRDKFEVRLDNTVGGGSYKANSTGERRRVDLAISLALKDLVMSRSNGKLNIVLYDECFDGLDAVGCENVIRLLQETQKSVESIFVITHNDHLKSYFDNVITVTKQGGETKVVND